jgi:hypothetical protein
MKLFNIMLETIFLIIVNVDAMASKGLRSTKLSTDTKLDAGDELRIPLKPLLAIACVVSRAVILFLLNHLRLEQILQIHVYI